MKTKVLLGCLLGCCAAVVLIWGDVILTRLMSAYLTITHQVPML
jgi:ABC-type amino acid transport system permease subunit